MSTTTLKMKLTMETMISNSGYSVQVQILSTGYRCTSAAMPSNATMILEFPNSVSPGEVVWGVVDILNRLNANKDA